ncbi:MAG: hypothetical protein GXP55_10895 [Deltaproteobacteria bacterium]|nr:hypothetical protein [Deltaproteobacteria bacterium]
MGFVARPRWLTPLLALSVVGGPLLQARAQGPVLHEYVPDVREDELPSLVMAAGGASEPAAIVYRGEVLPAPEDGARRPEEHAMRALTGPSRGRGLPGLRSPTFRPDRIPTVEGALGYDQVFTPGIVPFKRVSSLDMVALDGHGVPVLGVRDPTRHELEVEAPEAPPPDDRPRDRFWGSVVLDFGSGVTVPFPSVSPESRILSLRTEPSARLRIEEDGAGNFYATRLAGATGEVRVVFLTDAPRGYFNTPIPDLPAHSLANHVAPLPARLKREALGFARELGVTPSSSLPDALSVLAAHFRAFRESDEAVPTSDSIYLDIARARRGVCRHRSYAFLITAQALGIPTRFVFNETHAWVEVELPGEGFMRIDLGGAARQLDAHGAERPVYHARLPDPLPRPAAYLQSYSRLAGPVSGVRPEDAAPPSSGPVGPHSGGVVASQEPGAGPEISADEPPAAHAQGATPAASDVAQAPSVRAADAREPVELRLEHHRFEAFRGRRIELSGQARDPRGAGVAGLRVEIGLRGPGRPRTLGATVTQEGGWFDVTLGVPPDLEVGDYALMVHTPGDAHHLPATAR